MAVTPDSITVIAFVMASEGSIEGWSGNLSRTFGFASTRATSGRAAISSATL